MVFADESSTALIRFSVSSMRSAARGPDVHLERAGVDLGEELAAQDRPDERRCVTASRPKATPIVEIGGAARRRVP